MRSGGVPPKPVEGLVLGMNRFSILGIVVQGRPETGCSGRTQAASGWPLDYVE